MKKTAIATDKAPSAIGPYSQGIAAGGMVFVAGQTPLDPNTGALACEDIEGQTRQCLKNVSAILEAEGLTLDDVVKTTVFLNDMNDFAKMNAVYAEHFTKPYPARSAVEVSRLPKDANVEIEAIAYKG